MLIYFSHFVARVKKKKKSNPEVVFRRSAWDLLSSSSRVQGVPEVVRVAPGAPWRENGRSTPSSAILTRRKALARESEATLFSLSFHAEAVASVPLALSQESSAGLLASRAVKKKTTRRPPSLSLQAVTGLPLGRKGFNKPASHPELCF